MCLPIKHTVTINWTIQFGLKACVCPSVSLFWSLAGNNKGSSTNCLPRLYLHVITHKAIYRISCFSIFAGLRPTQISRLDNFTLTCCMWFFISQLHKQSIFSITLKDQYISFNFLTGHIIEKWKEK